MNLPPDMEPVVPDPRKLRRTAWTLVAIMILGGTLVYVSYERWADSKTEDTRPAFIHQIRKEHDLRVLLQDGSRGDLFNPRGRVWVVHTLALSQPETAHRSLDVMRRVAGKYAGNEDLTLVSLVVDIPPPVKLDETLATHAEALGIKLPQWWLVASEPNDTHRFVKAQLKAGIFPHQEEGNWMHDTSIVLIDRSGHIRRAVVPNRAGGPPYIAPFDFDQAARWDEEGKLTGTDRSNLDELETLLTDTIDTLLTETPPAR